MARIHESIDAAIRDRGVTNQTVADAVGVGQPHISNLRRGLADTGEDLVERLAAYFGEPHASRLRDAWKEKITRPDVWAELRALRASSGGKVSEIAALAHEALARAPERDQPLLRLLLKTLAREPWLLAPVTGAAGGFLEAAEKRYAREA